MFATNGGYYNRHDQSFKGYIGYGPFTIGWEYDGMTGTHGNQPSNCPGTVRVPMISGVDHTGNDVYYVFLGYMIVTNVHCGVTTTGTIAQLSLTGDDPFGIVIP